jgi:hypothetical protein
VAEVVLLPYLHSSERVAGERWEVIPRSQLRPEDAIEPWVHEHALGLLHLYKLRSEGWGAIGCVAKPSDGLVGQSSDLGSIRALHRAVVASVLDPNPSLSEKEKGHQVATSDNALVFAHRVDESGFVSVDYGVMVRAVVGGLQVGQEGVTIAAPPEIHVPFLHPSVDDVYLISLLSVLGKHDDDARRIGRAIDWLDLAWRNTSSIDEDTRIVALRAGFEVLLGVGDNTTDIREALTDLLEDETTSRATRTWKTLQGRERSEEMTDLGWWFTSFSFLRNAIMHGSDISDADYLHDDQRHLWDAERTLREAIKHLVANFTTDTILMSPLERVFREIDEESVGGDD